MTTQKDAIHRRLSDYLQRNQAFYLDLLRQMVSINSFTANAAGVNAVGDLTAAAFTDLGFAAEKVQSANPAYGRHLVLTRPAKCPSGETPKIGLVSHLDTVFPPEEEAAKRLCLAAGGRPLLRAGHGRLQGRHGGAVHDFGSTAGDSAGSL